MAELSPMTLHLLSLLDVYGDQWADDLLARANSECVHDDFDGLAEVKSISGRLISMRAASLVRSSRPYDGSPMQWRISEEGRAAWHAYRDGERHAPPSLSLSQIDWLEKLVAREAHVTLDEKTSRLAYELLEDLRDMRAELTKEDDGGN